MRRKQSAPRLDPTTRDGPARIPDVPNDALGTLDVPNASFGT